MHADSKDGPHSIAVRRGGPEEVQVTTNGMRYTLPRQTFITLGGTCIESKTLVHWEVSSHPSAQPNEWDALLDLVAGAGTYRQTYGCVECPCTHGNTFRPYDNNNQFVTPRWLSQYNFAVWLATTTIPYVNDPELERLLDVLPRPVIGDLMVYMHSQKIVSSEDSALREQYMQGMLLRAGIHKDVSSFTFEHNWFVHKGNTHSSMACMIAALFHMGFSHIPLQQGPRSVADAISMVQDDGYTFVHVPAIMLFQESVRTYELLNDMCSIRFQIVSVFFVFHVYFLFVYKAPKDGCYLVHYGFHFTAWIVSDGKVEWFGGMFSIELSVLEVYLLVVSNKLMVHKCVRISDAWLPWFINVQGGGDALVNECAEEPCYYDSIDTFKVSMRSLSSLSRGDFLKKVRYAQVKDIAPFQHLTGAKEIAFLQAFNIVKSKFQCPNCNRAFHLKQRLRKRRGQCIDDGQLVHYVWRNRITSDCPTCGSGHFQPSAVAGTMLEQIATDRWMDSLECMVMWCNEYPRQIIISELGHHIIQAIDGWCETYQRHAAAMADNIVVFADLKREIRPYRTQPNQAKPQGIYKKPTIRREMCKRPSRNTYGKTQGTRESMLKRPARAVLRSRRVRAKVVIQWDETLANASRKRSRLAKNARPKKDQIWIGGAVAEDHSDVFFFRVLKHPADAYDNRPRGRQELLNIFEDMGLERDDIFVSDCWKGTVAAVSSLKDQRGWRSDDLRHETCNHAIGEIVNANGFTTNQIESKWSVFKRWARKKSGGKLPPRGNRRAWQMILGEFTLRKYYQYSKDYKSSGLDRSLPQ